MRIPDQSAGVKRTMVGAPQAFTANQQVHPQQFGEPQLFCPPVRREVLQYDLPCTKDGIPGMRYCTQTCYFYYSLAFGGLGGGRTCEFQGSTCEPRVCGPCHKIGTGIEPPVF